MKAFVKLGFQTALIAVATLGIVSSALADDVSSNSADKQNRKIISATCFERGNLLFDLAKEQGEKLSQTKRVGDNGLLEAFSSPTDGTWTIVYSDGDKRSCIIASGDGLPVTQRGDEDARVAERVEAAI